MHRKSIIQCEKMLFYGMNSIPILAGFMSISMVVNLKILQEIVFGMREFKANGTRFEINQVTVFLRGTLECAIFPKTGYPRRTNTEEWKRIIGICKNHGLNHMRFHLWCPPEAAFVAADELGFYFQV